MKLLSSAILLLAFALFGAGQVRADGTSVDYVYQANGNTFTWELPSNPVIDPSNANSGNDFIIPDVSVTENGASFFGSFDFYSVGGGGGFILSFDNFNTMVVDAFGPQLYSGDEGAPTMLTGVFSLSDFGDGSNATSYSGNLQVPEPSTLLLLGVGLSAGLAVSFLRKN